MNAMRSLPDSFDVRTNPKAILVTSAVRIADSKPKMCRSLQLSRFGGRE